MFLTPAVRNLLLANVGLLLIPNLLGRAGFFKEVLGLHFLQSPLFSPYQLGTYMFMHDGFMHLLFNMLGLVFFGSWLERAWGLQRFLMFYFVCGIGAGLLYMGVNYWELHGMLADQAAFMESPTADGFLDFVRQYYHSYRDYLPFADKLSANPSNATLLDAARMQVNAIVQARLAGSMIGASGAVYGIILAFGLLFPNAEMFFFPLPFPVKAKYVVLFYGATAVYGVIRQAEGDNVAHLAHLGGMLFGWLMVRVYDGQAGR